VVRYPGSPHGTGGDISESGGYTFHRFVSSASFVLTGQSDFDWVDVANFLNTEVDSADYPGHLGTVQCEVWAETAATPVKARLWNATDGVSVGESVEVSSRVPVTVDFAVVLTPGLKTYRLQVGSTATGMDLYCAEAGLSSLPI
jgi:hypothetical protein